MISNLNVNGSFLVKANDVTDTHTRVRYIGTAYAVNIPQGVSGVVIEDVEIGGTRRERPE